MLYFSFIPELSTVLFLVFFWLIESTVFSYEYLKLFLYNYSEKRK